ncbi:unnamed protein product [Boreogadus saida]
MGAGIFSKGTSQRNPSPLKTLDSDYRAPGPSGSVSSLCSLEYKSSQPASPKPRTATSSLVLQPDLQARDVAPREREREKPSSQTSNPRSTSSSVRRVHPGPPIILLPQRVSQKLT